MGNVLAVQSEIAADVASTLAAELVDAAKLDATRTRDPAAYDRFLRASFFVNRRAPSDLEHARNYYTRALDADPGFARAWAGLANR